jgi:hypothetical protein
MAVRKNVKSNKLSINPPHRVTSIGNSDNSKPKSKHDKRDHKKYRGQGR